MTNKNMTHPSTKRPTPNPINAVMVEFFNGDTHEWEWYEILFDTTPYEAVKYYYESHDYDEPCTKALLNQSKPNQEKVDTEEARAYYITF